MENIMPISFKGSLQKILPNATKWKEKLIALILPCEQMAFQSQQERHWSHAYCP